MSDPRRRKIRCESQAPDLEVFFELYPEEIPIINNGDRCPECNHLDLVHSWMTGGCLVEDCRCEEGE